jgi:hypothetical protein
MQGTADQGDDRDLAPREEGTTEVEEVVVITGGNRVGQDLAQRGEEITGEVEGEEREGGADPDPKTMATTTIRREITGDLKAKIVTEKTEEEMTAMVERERMIAEAPLLKRYEY